MKKSVVLALLLTASTAIYSVVLLPKSTNGTFGNALDVSSSVTRIRLGNPEFSDLDGPGASVENHPAGLTFYQRNWGSSDLGHVEFSHGPYSFTVDNVLSVLGSADRDVPEGIFDWDISFDVGPEDAHTHEAARARVMSFLAMLRAAGWTRYIEACDPRLSGKQAWLYGASPNVSGIYSLDSTYTPTLEDWKSMLRNRPFWLFYANGAYLEVTVDESNMGGFVGKSTYLISAEVKSEYAYYGFGYFSGKEHDIANWKRLIPAELEKCHGRRMVKEAQLRAAGLTIDTTYQDPPIKALQASPGKAP